MRPALPLAILLAAGGVARADSERALSVGVGWATFSTPGKKTGNMEPPAITPDIGGTVGLMYEQMIGTDVGFRIEGAGGLFYGGADKKQSNTSYAGLADAGVLFRFDVLKYVPYAFAGLGGVFTSGGPVDRGIDPVLVIGGGLDILSSRQRSYGFELRIASFGADVTVVTIGVRGSTRWGYF